MNKQLITRILAQYSLTPKKIYAVQKGYRNKIYPVKLNNNQKIIIVFYKIEPTIKRKIITANLISEYLFKQQFPTRKVIKSNNNHSILRIRDQHQKQQLVCLYNYLPGTTINWEAYTQKHLKLLGQSMSNMHYSLQKFQYQNYKKIQFDKTLEILNQMLDLMISYFNNPAVNQAMHKKLNLKVNNSVYQKQKQLIKYTNKVTNQHALHLDFVRSNILFSKKSPQLQISGILDFEKNAIGPAIIDIARTTAFLLIDCKYKTEQKVRKYFLHSGYRKRGHNKLTNLEILNPLINFFLLFDFYKFLAHNPYESLNQNNHYTRTVKYLRKQQYLLST